MSHKTRIQIVVGLTTLIWVGVVIARGATFDLSLLSSFGIVVAVVVFMMTIVDRLLWRLPVVNVAFRSYSPLVRGTWKGRVYSSRRERPYEAFLVIEQTLSHVAARMLTETGWSETLAGDWGKSDDENPAIFYIWRRFPKTLNSVDEPDDEGVGLIDYGAGILEICGDSPLQIQGPYWTCEGHRGTLDFTAHKKKVCKSYQDAVALFVS